MTSPDNGSLSGHNKLLLVHAYVDGELDAVNTLAIKREIDADERLSNERANASALQNALRAHFPREAAPEQLQRRIDRAIGRYSAPRRPTWMAMAASVLLAIALSSSATRLVLDRQGTNPILAQVIDTHMRSLIAAKTVDVDSSDRHTVKPWFNGRLPQAPRVVDLASEGFPLKGARIDVIAATPVPTLVYSRRLHVISVFATRTSETTGQAAEANINGYSVVRWVDGETTYWAASDLNAQELGTFAQLFRGAPR
jgi:anti-sigma factor RsiW